ncbi:uncharacterized protein [Triticum aestivum]|uniref:uncharacterized protein isoform X2 n=1 Tax=Triticum aestivum TaxID=4565 RepID=UPI0008435C13|nr:uncharacterized protein LOC123183284 isoform X2 [Triticum aestivum]
MLPHVVHSRYPSPFTTANQCRSTRGRSTKAMTFNDPVAGVRPTPSPLVFFQFETVRAAWDDSRRPRCTIHSLHKATTPKKSHRNVLPSVLSRQIEQCRFSGVPTQQDEPYTRGTSRAQQLLRPSRALGAVQVEHWVPSKLSHPTAGERALLRGSPS